MATAESYTTDDYLAEALEGDDPRNALLDAVERLLDLIIIDAAGRSALRARLERLLPPEEAPDASLDAGVGVPGGLALDAMEAAQLLTLLIDLRKRCRGDEALQARIRVWRDRIVPSASRREVAA